LRVGVFGGAFNPPHIGHLVCAQEALLELGLDRVLLVPVGEAPHRSLEDDPGGEVRAALVEAAVGDDSRFEVSRMELERSGPSYTADTLVALREESPEDELFLILGGDQAAALPSWHEPEQVLSLATVCVIERVGFGHSAVGIRLSRLRGADRVRYLHMPLIQVSSTGIRRRVREGVSIRYLVPDVVRERIEEAGLYAAATEAAPA
jgi:nicotinate-nucleotide adenylyltransferase